MADDAQFFWATVNDEDPLAVRKDGETEPIAATPDALVDPYHLRNGDRVRCTLHHKRVQILGKVKGEFIMRWGYLKMDVDEKTGDNYFGHKAISLSGFTETPTVFATPHTEVPQKVRVATVDRKKDGFGIMVWGENDTSRWVDWMAVGY